MVEFKCIITKMNISFNMDSTVDLNWLKKDQLILKKKKVSWVYPVQGTEENRMQKTEQSLKDLQDINWINIYKMRIPEQERKERLFEEIMAKIIENLMKTINPNM